MKKPLAAMALLMAGAVVMGSHSGPAHAEKATTQEAPAGNEQAVFEDLDDRYSYAYGADLAKKFQAEGIVLNVELLAEAMKDVFTEGDTRMSEGEIAATIGIYQEIHAKKKEAERSVVAEKNKREGEAFLAANASNEGVVVTDSGLQYRVITEGRGDYTPTEDDVVTVHYRGKFVDGTEFDSTYSRDEPYTVKVRRLIDGWAEALQMMSEGAKWELYIPADIAYGEKGAGDYVGPNAVLIFEVELLDVDKTSKS